MSLLTSIFPKIPLIVSLYSGIKSEFEKFRSGKISEEELLQATLEMKNRLLAKAQELNGIISGTTSERDLANSCLDLSRRVERQANRIARNLASPVNEHEVLEGIEQIDRYVLTLEGRLCAYYEEIVAHSERDRLTTECYKKALNLARENPPPVFEENFGEYSSVVEGINITYCNDERAKLNRRLLQLPGMVAFLISLLDVQKRNLILGLINKYDETDSTTIFPLTESFLELLPCTRVLDYLEFSSEEELKRAFIKFFQDGPWLESYVFLMIDRAGYSTRLLNVVLAWNNTSLEVDVLALSSNNLFIFEVKDRTFSNGLSEGDVTDIRDQLEKIAGLGSSNIKMNYIFSIGDEYQENVKSKIEEISSSQGLEVKVIFPDNKAAIDGIVGKIRECLR